jgi:hypothetical protein
LVFGTALVNSYLIHKENYAIREVTLLQFRKSLARSELLGMLLERLKFGPREKSTSRTKRKLTDHKLEEKEGSARMVGRRGADCYEKIRQQQLKEASNVTAKKLKASVLIVRKFFALIVSTRSILPWNKGLKKYRTQSR